MATSERRRRLLDLDATDDTIHGEQEGRFFHGYYDSYCYVLPAPSCAPPTSTGPPARSTRSPGSSPASGPAGKVRIVLRGDSGFCREEARPRVSLTCSAWLARLKAVLAPEAWEAARLCRTTGKAARLFRDFADRDLLEPTAAGCGQGRAPARRAFRAAWAKRSSPRPLRRSRMSCAPTARRRFALTCCSGVARRTQSPITIRLSSASVHSPTSPGPRPIAPAPRHVPGARLRPVADVLCADVIGSFDQPRHGFSRR